MAMKSDGTVYVNTLIDTKGFGKGVNTMQKQIGGLSGAIGKLGTVIAATFAVGKLIQFGKEAIELGSDLQEVQNVVDVTFTTMNEKVNEFAKNAAETAGLSEKMAKRYTGTFGAMAKAFGFAELEAFNMSTSLTQLAGDVASFYNLTQDEAYTKLKSVFTGETESLKDLGVVMTQIALDSFAMAKGYGKTTKQMSEQEKVALRYAFVLDQLSSASGDFVRTQDSWANQMRILSLSFDSFKANIGQALINLFTPFLKVLNQIVSKMAQLSQHFVSFSEMLVGKSTSGGGGSPGDALAEIESGYEDVADATNEATKAQNKYLTGLDEIKTIASDSGSNTGSSMGSSIIENPENTLVTEETANAMVSGLVNRLKEIFADENWAGLGALLSDGIVLGLDTLSEKIKNIDWNGIGGKIGQFLNDIKWKDVFLSAGNFFETVIDSAIDAWKGSFDAEPIGTAIVSAIAIAKFTGLSDVIKNKLIAAFPSTLSVGKTILIAAITWEIGFDFGKRLAAGLFADTEEEFQEIMNFSWFGEGGFFEEIFSSDFDTLWDALIMMAEDGNGLLGILSKIKKEVYGTSLEFEDLFYGIWDAVEVISSVIKNWFNQDVKPWFTKEKWLEAMQGIKSAFENIWKGAVNVAIKLLNKFIDYINEKMHFEWEPFKVLGKEVIPGGSVQLFTIPKIPMLATGAVIPPNAPFMAMLGDQKHGTNIEAPLDTIKQAIREVVGSGNGGGQYAFTAQINRRTLFEEIIDEAKLRQSTSGRNPFDLA